MIQSSPEVDDDKPEIRATLQSSAPAATLRAASRSAEGWEVRERGRGGTIRLPPWNLARPTGTDDISIDEPSRRSADHRVNCASRLTPDLTRSSSRARGDVEEADEETEG